MLGLKRFAQAMVVFAIAACSVDQPIVTIEGADVTVIASELKTGQWQIDFVYPEPQSVLFFSRSRGDYRVDTWTPLGDAPAVQRLGGFDALVFDTPTAEFSYTIVPYSEGIRQDYTPFLAFSDGGTAVFTGQFELLAAADAEAVEALGGNLMTWQGEQPDLGVRVQSARPMIMQGARMDGFAEHVSHGGGTYIYVGDSKLQEEDSYIGVIDSALPDHLKNSLDQDLAALFKIYEARWGFQLPTRATLYYAFEGYDRPGFSNKGSVLGTDLMVLQSSGEGLREPDPENRVRNLWFFAHEGAHMFQGNVMDRFNVGPDSWVVEGGANAMANSAIQSLPDVSEQFILGEYQTAFENCIADLERGSLQTAHADGRFYAHYHCGQLFNAAADAALLDHDLYDFWKAFAPQVAADGLSPAEAFFDTLDALGADPSIASAIRALAQENSNDPRSDLSRLLSLGGLDPEFDENGALVSLRVPE